MRPKTVRERFVRDRVKEYRAKAAEMRQHAADAREPTVTKSYLTRAAEYDLLADSIEQDQRRSERR